MGKFQQGSNRNYGNGLLSDNLYTLQITHIRLGFLTLPTGIEVDLSWDVKFCDQF